MDELLIDASHDDGATFLTLAGEIDLASAPLLRESLEQARATSSMIELDMAQVTFMDSAGINVLIDASKASEGGLCIRQTSEAVRQLLDLTGLTSMFAPPS